MKYRSPIALAYLGDLGMADIARVEGCSVGTVKSRIHRGKKRLKEMLIDLIGDNDYA
jgi:RNA polymerase sigma-70 factor (ECF subfamily)